MWRSNPRLELEITPEESRPVYLTSQRGGRMNPTKERAHFIYFFTLLQMDYGNLSTLRSPHCPLVMNRRYLFSLLRSKPCISVPNVVWGSPDIGVPLNLTGTLSGCRKACETIGALHVMDFPIPLDCHLICARIEGRYGHGNPTRPRQPGTRRRPSLSDRCR